MSKQDHVSGKVKKFANQFLILISYSRDAQRQSFGNKKCSFCFIGDFSLALQAFCHHWSGESGDFEVVEPQTDPKCTEFGCVWGL